MVDEYKQDPAADKQPDCDMMKKDEEEKAIRLSIPSIAVLIVPTKGTDEAPKTVIDTSNLSEDDIEALRKQDPFLYYSIPSVRNAKLRLQSCAVAGEADPRYQDKENQEPTRSRRASCPSRGVETSSSAMVKRRSCDDEVRMRAISSGTRGAISHHSTRLIELPGRQGN